MANSKKLNTPTPETRSSGKNGNTLKRDAKAGTFIGKGNTGKSSAPRLTLVNGRKVYTSVGEPVRITRDQIDRAVASLKK